MPGDADVLISLREAIEAAGPAPVEELPGALVRAAAGVLGADGASLSLLSLDLRVPLGASSPQARIAERLQFTLGEGPCLDVLHGRQAVAEALPGMARIWPRFTRDLTAGTPFRSVASVPLPFSAAGGGGALDLYSRRPDGALGFDLAHAATAADWIVDQLVGAQPPNSLAGIDDATDVPWLQAPATRRRMEVWVAIGVVITDLDVDAPDALTRLRAWAAAHDSDLDSVAADVVDGRVRPEQLGG